MAKSGARAKFLKRSNDLNEVLMVSQVDLNSMQSRHGHFGSEAVIRGPGPEAPVNETKNPTSAVGGLYFGASGMARNANGG